MPFKTLSFQIVSLVMMSKRVSGSDVCLLNRLHNLSLNYNGNDPTRVSQDELQVVAQYTPTHPHPHPTQIQCCITNEPH